MTTLCIVVARKDERDGVWLIPLKLEQSIDDLMNLINSPSQAPSSSMQHAASRHRDNLDDYRRDFLRTRVSLSRGVLSVRSSEELIMGRIMLNRR